MALEGKNRDLPSDSQTDPGINLIAPLHFHKEPGYVFETSAGF